MKISIEIPNGSASQTGNTRSPEQTISISEADGGAAVFTQADATNESISASDEPNSFDAGSPPEWLLTALQKPDGETETHSSTEQESIDAGSAAM